MLKIPYGVSNFERIRTKGFLYVDKTHFIERVENLNHVIHLRPRRFGKSLFLDMLDSYYDIDSKQKFDSLFTGLYVYDNPTPYQNSYHILRFDFSGIQNTKSETLEDGFVRKINAGVQEFIDRYKFNIEITEDNSGAQILTNLLTAFSKLRLENKIYILIDEYDHFTNSLLTGDGQDFLTILSRGGFVRSFYEIIKEATGKGVVERIFITGVMSVTLDSMTSGFNIASKITTDEEFTDMMGFTSEEVKNLLNLCYQKPGTEEVIKFSEYEQATTYEIFKDNYNGYLFSEETDIKVFNSTLIMFYLNKLIRSGNAPRNLVDSNLNQSGATIENIVNLKNREDNYELIESIIHEKVVTGRLEPFINIDTKFDKNDLITLLFNIGLLTIKGFEMETQFEIPNQIIKKIYFEYLKDLVQKQSNYKLDLTEQKDAIMEVGLAGKIDQLTKLVSAFLTNTSPRNAIKFDEKYIKLIYMMLLAYSDQFSVYDEFVAGQGFGDLVILKAPNSTAKYEIIIELKYIKKSETTPEKITEQLADGIRQIDKYMQDPRLAKREMKKFVVIFSGFDVVEIEEIK